MTALMDQLRLEILATTSGNAIANHSGQSGSATGWAIGNAMGLISAAGSTITADSGLAFGYNGKALKLHTGEFEAGSGFPGTAVVLGPTFPIVGNQWTNFAVTLNRTEGGAYTRGYGLGVLFYSATNVLLADRHWDSYLYSVGMDAESVLVANSRPLYNTGSGNPDATLQAPSGTAYARIVVAASFAPGSIPPGPATIDTWVSRLMVVVGNNEASVDGPVFSDVPETWQNVIPKSLTARVLRGGDVDGVADKLDAGLLVATVKDPLLTPENNDRVRPGRPVRLTALNGSTWEPIFKGKIVQATTSYAGDVPVVTITGTDATADLDNYPQPLGKSGSFKQRVDSALVNVPVTYTVADTDANVAQATISADESGTPLTQLVSIRDSLRGLFYVARDNTLKCFANNSYPSQTPTVTFSDDELNDPGTIGYTEIDTNFDSKNMVNTLTVTKSALSEKDGSKVYGPYVNQASVDAWGSVSADLKVNDGTPSTLAAAYLAVYDEPTIFCDSLTFDATADVSTAIVRELYEAARVKFAKATMDTTYRVISIEHIITADKWTVTLKFKPLESTSSVVVTNPPGGPNTGPKDLLPFTREIQTGEVSITTSTAGIRSATANFDKPYESAPRVYAIARSGLPGTRVTEVTATSTPTGCEVFVGAAVSSAAAATFIWVAIPT